LKPLCNNMKYIWKTLRNDNKYANLNFLYVVCILKKPSFHKAQQIIHNSEAILITQMRMLAGAWKCGNLQNFCSKFYEHSLFTCGFWNKNGHYTYMKDILIPATIHNYLHKQALTNNKTCMFQLPGCTTANRIVNLASRKVERMRHAYISCLHLIDHPKSLPIR